MSFHFQIRGYGFGFQVGGFDAANMCFVILSWHIMKKYEIWCSEMHSRGTIDRFYHYRCIKNGKVVEDFTLRSPVVTNA